MFVVVSVVAVVRGGDVAHMVRVAHTSWRYAQTHFPTSLPTYLSYGTLRILSTRKHHAKSLVHDFTPSKGWTSLSSTYIQNYWHHLS